MGNRGLWANIHAKRKRIKAGSGETMRSKGDKGAPTEENLKRSQAKTGAWTRKEGKNPSGGLNEKGRRSYERENPGSNLQAPAPGTARGRKFCGRMCGMKKKRTGKEGQNDPNSRINKALRKWRCKC